MAQTAMVFQPQPSWRRGARTSLTDRVLPKAMKQYYRTKAIVPCACRAVTNDERPVASGESITAFAGAYPTIESLQSQV